MAALLLALAWAPVPLGSNRPWAAALLAMVLWAWVLVGVAGRTLSRTPWQPAVWRRALWPLMPLVAFVVLVALQWRSPGLGSTTLPSTQDAAQTSFYLLVALLHLAAWLMVLLCVHNPQRVKLLLGGVVLAGVLQAGLAVVLHASRSSYQFMFHQFSYGGRASGTFPNPDHLAGFMELCLAAGFGLLVAQFGGSGKAEGGAGWQYGARQALAFLLSRKMLLRLMLVVLVVALVMTHSRMGNAAFFISLLLVGCVVAVVSRKLRRPAMWLVASMVLVDVIVIGQWVGLDRVVERLQGTAESTAVQQQADLQGALPELAVRKNFREESVQERLRIPLLSLQLVEARPWFGHGAGTYYIALPAIKPAGFPHLWDHAHNDYVEWAVDTGLVGLGLLLAVALTTAWRALRLLRDSEPRLHRGVGTAALMALATMGLHGLVDFNLQIPANAMILVVLLALVWAVPVGRPVEARRGRASTAAVAAAGSARTPSWIAAAACVFVASFVVWRGVPTLLSDFGTLRVRQQVAGCASTYTKWRDDDWAKAEATLAWGKGMAPDNAVLRDVMGQLHGCHGGAVWTDTPARELWFGKAAAEFEASLALRAGWGATWSSLAVARYAAGAAPDQVNQAWLAALRHGPHEAPVQVALFDLGLRVWDSATPDMQAWVMNQYRSAQPDSQKRLRALATALQRANVLPTSD